MWLFEFHSPNSPLLHNPPKIQLWCTHSPAQKALTSSAAPTKPSPQSLDDLRGPPHLVPALTLPASANSSLFLQLPLPPALPHPAPLLGSFCFHTPQSHPYFQPLPVTRSHPLTLTLISLSSPRHLSFPWTCLYVGHCQMQEFRASYWKGFSEGQVCPPNFCPASTALSSVLHIIQKHWVLPGKCTNARSVLVWLSQSCSFPHTHPESCTARAEDTCGWHWTWWGFPIGVGFLTPQRIPPLSRDPCPNCS